MRKSLLFSAAVVVAMVLSGVRVYADDAGDIEVYSGNGNTSPDTMVLWDNTSGNYPIVNAIGSQPGVYGGHTFTYWAAFAQDSTGSMDLDFSTSSLNKLATINGTTYGTPLTGFALGMAFQGNMAWVPYHQLPELNVYTNDPGTYVSVKPNTVPLAPAKLTTIENILSLGGSVLVTNGGGATPNTVSALAGYYLEIQNVTISGSTGSYQSTFPSYLSNIAVESYTISDGTTNMLFFDWTTSYSDDAALGGKAVPTGPVNVYGVISVNSGGANAEFIPFLIVPEPSAFVLAGLGLAGLLAIRRRRS